MCVCVFRGQLLPKQPELLHVFKQRRVDEKKRADEQMREQSTLEQILARQRQKLDQVSVCVCISSHSGLLFFDYLLDNGEYLFNFE